MALVSEPVAGGWMSYSTPDCWSNQACGLGLSGPVSAEDLDRLVEFYLSRDAEPRIEVCPSADVTLIEGLQARGFSVREFEVVLICGLGGDSLPPASGADESPGALEMSELDLSDDDTLDTFIEVSTIGFRPEDEPVPPNLEAITRRVAQHARCRSYLARWDGEPVGGGMVEIVGELACLLGGSVMPRYRRRGIQRALMRRRMVEAAATGCEFIVVHSRPGIATERNARRLGFVPSYTKSVLTRPRAD